MVLCSQVQAILEAWLHPSTGKAPPGSSPFQFPLNPELWVLPKAPGSEVAPHPVEDLEDKWLLRKRSQAQVTMETSTDLLTCHLERSLNGSGGLFLSFCDEPPTIDDQQSSDVTSCFPLGVPGTARCL